MARPRLRRYRLLPAALSDMETIWRYTAEHWSTAQADRYTDDLERAFGLLVTMPEIARERHEFTPPVRIHPCASHLIVYRIGTDSLEILRVLGKRQNWRSLLESDV